MKRIAVVLTLVLVLGCQMLKTDNPTNPEADNPIISGEEVMPPLGCTLWRGRVGERNADC